MEFEDTLAAMGFRAGEGRSPSGVRLFTASPNRYLTYTVHAYEDGTAIFSWEFALGEYLANKGIQVGSDETLNQFMYPRQDEQGPQDQAWLSGAIERAGGLLKAIRFDEPDG